MDRDQLMNDERLDALERWKDEMTQRFAEAFPAGDHTGHRKYHELQMELLAERRRLRAAIVEKTLSALIWSAIAALAIGAWHLFINKIKAGL